MSKLNDLSNSQLFQKYFNDDFVAENNLAVAIMRISSKKQERGNSIADQDETIEKYIEREGLQMAIDPWKFKETASKHEDRYEFNSIIEFIRNSQNTKRAIKHVVFAFQSRSNRNRFSARVLEDLVDLGVTLHFARDGRKLCSRADIAQWLMWHVENIKNEAYITELRRNVMGGMIKSIEGGLYPGKPKWGYKGIGNGSNRSIVFDGERACYMKRAFTIVIENGHRICNRTFTDEDLKKQLDEEFPQIKKTPSKKRFCELLRDPWYYGFFKYDGTIFNGKHQAVVSKSDWLQVQDILEGRRRKRRLSKAHPYIGMMLCSGRLIDVNGNLTNEICGCSITAESIRRTYKNGETHLFNYYRCSRPNGDERCSQRDKKHIKTQVGRKASYREEEVEEIFQEMFRFFSFDEVTCERMKQYLWKQHFEEKQKDHSKKDELTRRMATLDRNIETAYEDKVNGDIPKEMWREQSHKWNAEKKNVAIELAALDAVKDDYMTKGVELIELMQHAEMIFKNATADVKRKMVELTSSNLLLADGTLQYNWEMPFAMLAVNGEKEKWLGKLDEFRTWCRSLAA